MTNCFNCNTILKSIILCDKCSAVQFCSNNCKNDTESFKNHTKFCDLFSEFMILNDLLMDFPFKFSIEDSYEIFLSKENILGKGMWKFKLINDDEAVIIDKIMNSPFHMFGSYVLFDEMLILSMAPCIQSAVTNWSEYFSWRNLNFTSPVAGLLHWPLTTYHILVNILNFHDNPQFIQCKEKNILSIHFVGVEIEVNMLPAFIELQHLLKDFNIYLSFIGNNIPSFLNKREYIFENVHFYISSSLYHKAIFPKPFCRPDIIIGFNAGLSVFSSWKKSLQKMMRLSVPVIFTDYCKFSAHESVKLVKDNFLHLPNITFLQITVNAFRSPFREQSNDVNFALFSNAFIYGMLC